MNHLGASGSGLATAAFGDYQNADTLRHAEFLRNDHALLQRYMGEVAFNAMSQHFGAAYPSDYASARWYSRHLPDFLQDDQRYATRYELASLTRLENAFNSAFDAADCKIFTALNAANVNPQLFGEMILVFSTSAIRLTINDNITSIWSALKADQEPPKPHRLATPQHVIVWRQALASRFRILGNEEAVAVDCALQGLSFSLICETLALCAEPETAAIRATAYLRGWLDAELVSAVRFSNDAGEK
jgi:hypothetical protein